MNFLTEEDIRARNVLAGGTFYLQPGERLTPSAMEYAMQERITVTEDATGGAVSCPSLGSCSIKAEMTLLDAGVEVPKNHPSIVMRGKLDMLLAQVVLTQTQFDPKDRKPAFLKECLNDIHAWVLVTLQGEVTGQTVCATGMGGMDIPTLHLISQEPKKYLGLDHMAAHAAMGGNVALINWLRASVRETEVVAVNCSKNMDVLCSLNRLSSALYVLMLLTVAAEHGLDLATLRKA